MIILVWLLFAILIGVWAQKLHRVGFAWAILAVLISPLIAALFLLVLGKDGLPCPECKSTVIKGARTCAACGAKVKFMHKSDLK